MWCSSLKVFGLLIASVLADEGIASVLADEGIASVELMAARA